MGYVFLAIALFAGVTKGYCGKKTSGYTKGIGDAMLANLLRMVLCVGIGFLLILIRGELAYMSLSPSVLAITVLSGVATAAFVVTWLLAVKKGAYMMVDVFLMLGVLVPLLAGRMFLHEVIRPNQWVGMAVLMAAVLLMCSYSSSLKGKLTLPALGLLVLSGMTSGIADFSQKLFVRTAETIPVSVFNFYTYVFSMTVLALFSFLYNKKEGRSENGGKSAIFVKIAGYILVMAVCLFAHSYFKTMAAMYMDSAQLYPLNQGCALILSSLMSAFLFGEKMTVKSVLGLVLAFVGLIVINVL